MNFISNTIIPCELLGFGMEAVFLLVVAYTTEFAFKISVKYFERAVFK